MNTSKLRSKVLFGALGLGIAAFLVACNPTPVPEANINAQIPEGQDIPELATMPPCPNNYNHPPEPVYPADGDTMVALQPEFEWTFPYECQPLGFRLRVGTILDPQSDDVFDGPTEGLLRTYSGITLQPATWYRWRVYAQLVPGVSVYNGNFTSFLTGPTCEASQLVAPGLIYPADGSVYTGKSWGNPYEVEADISYPDGVCLPDAFVIYISETADFSTSNLNVFSPEAPSLFYSSNPDGSLLIEDDSNDVPDCTTLYWKAWALVDGVAGPESDVHNFFSDINGTCLIPPQYGGMPFIRLPQNANCRASDYTESKNLSTLFEGQTYEVLAINPQGTHLKVMDTESDLKCWVWADLVTLYVDGEETDPNAALDRLPVEYAPSPTPTPTLEPTATPTATPTPSMPQCSDGIDNDGDGRVDYNPNGRGDPECKDAKDNNEAK